MTQHIRMVIGSALMACAMVTLCTSCDEWIDQAKTPQNTLRRDQINEPSMIASVMLNKGKEGNTTLELKDGPLAAYLQTVAGEATAEVNLALGAMTDELSPSAKPNIQLYRELKLDILQVNSNSTARVWDKVQNLRARAQEILEVESSVVDNKEDKTKAIKAYGKFIGHLYLGYSYQLLANTFSADANKEASIRVAGTMMSHDALRSEALKHYTDALNAAKSADFKTITKGVITAEQAERQAYGLILKLKFYEGKYDEVANLWDKAYKAKDAFAIVYNERGDANGIYNVVGTNNVRDAQIDPDLRAALRNAAEKKRLPVLENKDKFLYTTAVERYSPIVLIDDVELQLIKAELILRGKMTGDALAAVNDVIVRYDAPSAETAVPTLATIEHLRRVYLSLRGERAMDFRRGAIGNEQKLKEWEQRKVHFLPMPELEYKP